MTGSKDGATCQDAVTRSDGDNSIPPAIPTFAARFLPLRRLGWAFLLAWVFCVFYTDATSGYVGGIDSTGASSTADIPLLTTIFYSSLPLAASIAMLIIIVLAEKRFGSPASHPRLLVAAPIITAISTPLLFVELPSPAATAAIFAIGAVLTGIGSGMLWVMWGEYYCTLNRDDVEFLAPVSSIVALLLILTVANVTGWLSLAITTSFPLLCGLCLILSLRDAQMQDARSRNEYPYDARTRDGHPHDTRTRNERQHDIHPDAYTAGLISDYDHVAMRQAHEEAAKTPLASLHYMGRTNLGILACCLVVCIEGTYVAEDSLPVGTFDLVLLFSGFIAAAVALSATSKARRITSSFLFRWMCPLLVLGLACVVWSPGDPGVGSVGIASGATVAYTISIASRLAFCLFTQMYFALIAARGKVTPTQSYGLGWISVHLGDWIGVMCIVCIEHFAGAAALASTGFVIFLIVALVAVTMYVLGRSDLALDAPDQPEATTTPAADITSTAARLSAENIDAASVGGDSGNGDSRDNGRDGSLGEGSSDLGGGSSGFGEGSGSSFGEGSSDFGSRGTGNPGIKDADFGASSPATRIDIFERRLAELSVANGLTPRETEILRLLARGRSIPYIRDELIISKDTASTHVKHIYAKLDVHSRQELIDFFADEG